MAVSNQDNVNLAPSYQQVIGQLENRASMESNRATLEGTASKVVNRVDQEMTAQRAFQQKMASEGRTLVTDDGINEFAKHVGVDPSVFKKYKGLWMKPEEVQSFGEQELLAQQFKSPKEQAAARINPKAASEAVIGRDKSVEQLLINEYQDGKISFDEMLEKAKKLKASSSSGANSWYYYTDPDTGEKFRQDKGSGNIESVGGPPPLPKDKQLADNIKYLNVNEKKTLTNTQKAFDKEISPSKKTLDELDKLETSIKNNNPISFFNNKIELVKLGGISAGRIAQGEIVQEAGARDFISKTAQRLQTLTQGDWTPENKKLILQYIGSLRDVEKEHVSNVVDSHADLASQQLPRVDPEFVKGYLGTSVKSIATPKDDEETAAARKLLTDNNKAVTPQAIAVAKKYLAAQGSKK